jgi:hypothetical protein
VYLTSHRVRDRQGFIEIHTFLHAHDRSECPFPAGDPWSVPDHAPGRLVRSNTILPIGGNSVLSYLDLIVTEERLDPNWVAALRGIAVTIRGAPSPFRARVGPIYLAFAADDLRMSPTEYSELLTAALLLYYEDAPTRRLLRLAWGA